MTNLCLALGGWAPLLAVELFRCISVVFASLCITKSSVTTGLYLARTPALWTLPNYVHLHNVYPPYWSM